MHILVVTQYFWPEISRLNDICTGFKEKGHQVTVLTGIPNYPEGHFFSGYGFFGPRKEDYRGIKVIRAPLVPRFKGTRLQLALNYLSFAIFASCLAPFRCREKYDLIFVYQLSPVTMALPAVVLKKLKKLPLILYILDLWPESLSAVGAVKSPLILRWVTGFVRFIYRHCDEILVSSRGFIERVKAMGVRDAIIRYWPQWAEELYQVVEVKEESPESKEMPRGFRVMFAGNVGAAQGFVTIIEAAEKLKNYPNIHWVILGNGRMKQWVEEQIKQRGLGNTVHLLGRRPVEQMPRYFALADVMLVTLKKEPLFSLTLPAKIQSYLACGRPIIAAVDGEGACVVKEAAAGFSCPADDADSLSGLILQMCHLTEGERLTMGRNGRAYFEAHFKREKLLKELDGWMHSLHSGPRLTVQNRKINEANGIKKS